MYVLIGIGVILVIVGSIIKNNSQTNQPLSPQAKKAIIVAIGIIFAVIVGVIAYPLLLQPNIQTSNLAISAMKNPQLVKVLDQGRVSKIGNFRLTALGTMICTIGFFGLVVFHSTEFMISAALGIISIGLSFAFVGGFNIILVSSPHKVEDISLGMSVLLILVGQSLGPSVAGMFQQMYSQTIPNVPGVFPSALSYMQIFSSAGILSLVLVVLVVLLRNKVKALPSYNLES